MSGPASTRTPAPIVHLTRRYHFSASHRLHTTALTDAQNRDTYGKCNNPHGHGHNYTIDITVCGPVDTTTGFVIDLPALDALAQRELLDRFDESNLNTDPTFTGHVVPSTENLTHTIERLFRAAVPLLDPRGHLQLSGIRIEETGNNSFELPAQPEPTLPHRPHTLA